MKSLSVILPMLIGLAVLLGGCDGGEDDGMNGAVTPTPRTPTTTSAATPSATPAEEMPPASPTLGASPSPNAPGPQSEADRALAAAEAILHGAARPGLQAYC